jgi:hypothetical protein
MALNDTVRTDAGNSQSIATALQHALQGEAGAPYLGDPEEVNSLVRAFLSEDLERALAASQGTLTGAQAAGQATAACERMARIFTGRDARYAPIPGWHTAPVMSGSLTLHSHIQATLGAMNPPVEPEYLARPHDAATALFSVFLLQYRAGIATWAAGGTDAALQALGEDLADLLTRHLLGQGDN